MVSMDQIFLISEINMSVASEIGAVCTGSIGGRDVEAFHLVPCRIDIGTGSCLMSGGDLEKKTFFKLPVRTHDLGHMTKAM